LTIVGNKIFSCEIDSQASKESRHDWRRSSKIFSVPHKIINLPFSLEKKCIRLVEELGLLFGAIDIIKTPEDQYIFLEVNPNGQWLWIEQLTGAKISTAIADLLSGN
jgi:glutathione synthase/RimK-type ligase-like ATP-grasp enzyme